MEGWPGSAAVQTHRAEDHPGDEESEENTRHYRPIMSRRLLSLAITNSARFNDKCFAGFHHRQPVIPTQYPVVGLNH